MTEAHGGVEFTIEENNYLESYNLLTGVETRRYIAKFYDPSGKFVVQGGSTTGRLSALSDARRNLYDRYGSYANGRINYK